MGGFWLGVRSVVLAVSATAVLAAGATAGGNHGDDATPSLEGEVMLSGSDSAVPVGAGTFETTLRCGATSNWWTYSAAGIATGPYPGTFTESGTVYVDAPATGVAGPLMSLHADFTIASGDTVITGTKDLQMAPTNKGSCVALADSVDSMFLATATYQARIDTRHDAFTDSGTATLDTERSEKWLLLPTGSVSLGGISRFQESFDLSSGVVPIPESGDHVTGGGWVIAPNGGRLSFGFEAKRDDGRLRGGCNAIDHAAKVHIKCVSVDTLLIVGTHATLTGDATVNCVRTRYQIDVDDLGESGSFDTFRIRTDSGYSGGGTLQGGNIKIH